MKVEELVKRLKKFGLSENEAKAYWALTTQGSCPAAKICKHTGISSSKIYEILKSLESRGLAEMWPSKPAVFKAVLPKDGLERVIDRKKKEISLMEKEKKIIAEHMKPIYNNNNKSEIWTFEGRSAFLDKIVEMVNRIENFGYGLTKNFARTLALEEAWRKAAKRGATARLLGIGPVNPNSFARALWHYKHGVEIRLTMTQTHLKFYVADDKEACLKVSSDPSRYEFIWTNDKAFLKILRYYFEDLWKKSKEFNPKAFNLNVK